MTRWYNATTRLCWRAILEDWDSDGLDKVGIFAKDPVKLALKLRETFENGIRPGSCPFLRHVYLRALKNVCWREIADRLLLMVLTRQHRQLKEGGGA